MSEIIIEELNHEDIQEVAAVISQAFHPTPVVVAVFKGQTPKTLRHMRDGWVFMLKHFPGKIFVAKNEAKIVGVLRMVKWPKCQPRPAMRLRMLPVMLMSMGSIALRVMKFRGVWEKHDPKNPHWHLDPLTVLPEKQGQGVGSQLLKHFCEIVDENEMPAYLETDQQANVRLYQRFGFEVTGEISVFGITTWLMWRPQKEK